MAKLAVRDVYAVPTLTYAGPARVAQISTADWKKLEAVRDVSLGTITGSARFVKNGVVRASANIQTVRRKHVSLVCTPTCARDRLRESNDPKNDQQDY